MIASFDNLYAAKIAYNMGEVNYRCLVCKKVHNSRVREYVCEETLKYLLCKDLLNASSFPLTLRNLYLNQVSWQSIGVHTKALYILIRACTVEPHWLMLRNKMPIIHEILNNRLTEEDKQLFKIRY